MPMRGLLNITYYSGEGAGKNGCKPYIAFRKMLLNMVLINEEEVVEDSARSKPPHHKHSPGDRAFQKHYGRCFILCYQTTNMLMHQIYFSNSFMGYLPCTGHC
jgi:hypothetical protein